MAAGDLGNLRVSIQVDLDELTRGLAQASAEIKAASEEMQAATKSPLEDTQRSYDETGKAAKKSADDQDAAAKKASASTRDSATRIKSDLSDVTKAHSDVSTASKRMGDDVDTNSKRAGSSFTAMGADVRNTASGMASDFNRLGSSLREFVNAHTSGSSQIRKGLDDVRTGLSNMEGAARTSFQNMLSAFPALRTAVDGIKSAVDTVGDAFVRLGAKTSQTVKELQKGVQDVEEAMKRWGATAVSSLEDMSRRALDFARTLPGVETAIQSISRAATETFDLLRRGFEQASRDARQIVSDAKEVSIAFGTTIANGVRQAYDAVSRFSVDSIKAMRDFGRAVDDAVRNFPPLVRAIDDIQKVASTAFAFARDRINDVRTAVDNLRNALSPLLEEFRRVFGGIGDVVGGAATVVRDRFAVGLAGLSDVAAAAWSRVRKTTEEGTDVAAKAVDEGGKKSVAAMEDSGKKIASSTEGWTKTVERYTDEAGAQVVKTMAKMGKDVVTTMSTTAKDVDGAGKLITTTTQDIAKGAADLGESAVTASSKLVTFAGNAISAIGPVVNLIPGISQGGRVFEELGSAVATSGASFAGAGPIALAALALIATGLAGVVLILAPYVALMTGAIVVTGIFTIAVGGMLALVGIVGGILLGLGAGIVALAATTQGWTNATQNQQSAQQGLNSATSQAQSSSKALTTAQQQHTQAVDALTKAQDAYNKQPTKSNLDSVKTAQDRVNASSQNLTQAQKAASDATGKQGQAQNALNDANSKAHNPLQQLIDDLNKAKKELGDLAAPAAAPILALLDSMIPRVEAIAAGILKWFTSMEPQVLQVVAAGFNDVLNVIEYIGPYIGDIITNFLAMPGIGDILKNIADVGGQTLVGFLNKLLDMVRFVVENWKTWGPVVGDVFSAVGKFVNDFGGQLVQLGQWFVTNWPAIVSTVHQLSDAFGAVMQVLGPIIQFFWTMAAALYQNQVFMDALKAIALAFGALVVVAIAAILISLAPLILSFLIVGGIIEGVIFIVQKLAPIAGPIFSAIGATIHGWIDDLNKIKDALGNSGFIQTIKSWIGDLNHAKDEIGKFKDEVVKKFNELGPGIKYALENIPILGFFITMAEKLVGHSIVTDLVRDICNAFGELVGCLTGALGPLVKIAETAFNNVWKKLQQIWGAIVGDAQRILGGIGGIIGGIFNAVWTEIVRIWNGVWNFLFGGSVIPDIVKGFQSWFGGLWGFISGIFTAIWSFIVSVWSAIWSTLSAVWNAIWSTAVSVFSAVYNTVASWFTNAWNFIVSVWNAVWGFLSGLWNNLWAWASSTFGNIYNSIATWFNNAWNFIVSIWNAVWGFLSGLWNNLWAWASSTFSNIYNTISTWFTNAWNFIVSVWTTVWGWLSALWTNLWNWATTTFTNIYNTIVTWFTNAWNFIVSVWQTVWGWLTATWNAIWNFAVQTFTNIYNTIVQWFTAVWNFISNLWNTVWGWLRSVWNGLWGDAGNFFQQIHDTVTTWTQRLSDSVTQIWTALTSAVHNAISTLATNAKNDLNWIITNVINKFLDTVWGAFHGFGLDLPIHDLPTFAEGGHVEVTHNAVHAFAEGGVPGTNAGIYRSPTFLVGEGRAPETVIPWDPAHRERALRLWLDAGEQIGALASGGTMAPSGGMFSGKDSESMAANMPLPSLVTLVAGAEGQPQVQLGQGPSINAPTSGKGGQCLEFVSHVLGGKFAGVPAAKDMVQFINSASASPGEVFVATMPPFGHAGFVINPPTMVLDSNWGEDEMIREHALSDIHPIAGYVNLGAQLGTLAGGAGGGGPDIGQIIDDAINGVLGGIAGKSPKWLGDMPSWILHKIGDIMKQWIQKTFGDKLKAIGSAFSGLLSGLHGKVSPEQLHAWMSQIGFNPAGGTAWADRIVNAESGFNPDAIGPAVSGDGGSIGLWQIQPAAWPQFDKGKLHDGLYNTQAAQQVYNQQGPGAWSTNEEGGVLMEWLRRPPVKFDEGYGIIPEGLSMVENNTGAPETLVNPDMLAAKTNAQMLEVLRSIDEKPLGTFSNHFHGTNVSAEDVGRAIIRRAKSG